MGRTKGAGLPIGVVLWLEPVVLSFGQVIPDDRIGFFQGELNFDRNNLLGALVVALDGL
jgi:hypothetical protein